jgi:hypothetical protein
MVSRSVASGPRNIPSGLNPALTQQKSPVFTTNATRTLFFTNRECTINIEMMEISLMVGLKLKVLLLAQ